VDFRAVPRGQLKRLKLQNELGYDLENMAVRPKQPQPIEAFSPRRSLDFDNRITAA
jgi:hypothetical protein